MRLRRWVAPIAVGCLVLAGLGLLVWTRDGTAPNDLGLALVSGAILSATFLAIEVTMSADAERRSARASLDLQLSTTENLDAIGLADADLRGRYLPNRRWVAAQLDRADLRGAQLFFGNFRSASLREVAAEGADLGGSTFEAADLTGARLADADLFDCSIAGATLVGADLRGADLRHSNAAGAALVGADLTGADLRNVDLRGADLTGARLAGVELGEVEHDAATRWPAGLEVPAPG